MKVRVWLGFTVFALAAMPAPARADEKQICLASSERGQRVRLQGKLRDARNEFATCSRAECPAVIRNDCASWLNEVTNALPSIAISVRDAQGKDMTDVRVLLDGELFTDKLDGRALPVDVGSHLLRVEHLGDAPMESTILVREGEKARGIDIRFGASAPTKPRDDAPPKPRTPAASVSRGESGHTIPPWIVVGGGAAVAVTGAVLYLVGRGNVPDECDYSSRKCEKGTPGTVSEDASNATKLAQFGLAAGIVGVVIAGAGLTWHFLEPTEEKPAATSTSTGFSPWIRPDVSLQGAGVSLGGTL